MKRLGITAIMLLFALTMASGQNCKKFHLYGACMQFPGNNFKMDGQSRSNVIGVGDKLIYSMVFYGERQYKLYFCASEEFYPVHFRLVDSMTGQLIYDNSKDDYPDNVTVNIEYTRKINVELEVLALEASEEVKLSYLGCSGTLMLWKPIEK
ncbi:MAG: hypothetical protein ACOYXB_02370 [Bacteroidota bacterium]